MTTVIFACVQNAGRSQMAAAFFNRMANPELACAISAGTRPAREVHREVVDAMRELGHDLSQARPKLLTPELARGATWLITMGCGEECPVIAGVHREDWPLLDPAELGMPDVRKIRDQIKDRVGSFIAAEGL